MLKLEKKCSECQASFSCGGNCWCMQFPVIMPLDVTADCLCPTCLTQKIQLYLTEYLEELTPEKVAKIQSLPQGNLIEGIDYTINERGLYIFSKFYLLKRGTCCQNGCLNCPYKK